MDMHTTVHRCPCCCKMENSAFEGDVDRNSMELKDVKIGPVNGNGQSQPHKCEPDRCRSLHAKMLVDKTKMATNPWDRLKTTFLVGIIATLVLWLVVFVGTSRMGLV
ncbi:uncharacterized protein LOC128982945 isoform X2 [Macrosteles quadrilineatus]|uniref:uncharacterized protein LOC128982945 isoform X2 n=1 Tax=Macrosteles quadrilineatus TaxID=74068 RepID=UPI0023E2E672|nr:uncharacterized protein LOC128982945 isoform X2 [Macrosteles quadrilineatus]